MLVQALAAYADEYLSEQLAAEAWEEKPVPFLLEIGPGGVFLSPVRREKQVVRGTKTFNQPESLTIPKSPVNRNSGLHPLLGADDIKYVLGVGPWSEDKPEAKLNAAERHEAFVDLLKRAASKTLDPALEDCVRFYERPDQVELARESLKDAKPGTLIALSAGGPVVSRPTVRTFWNRHFETAFQTRVASGGFGECLVSGQVGPIAPTHDKIKGLSSVGGQASGVSLMSFDKSAFRSYGWEQNANSPVSPGRATAYVLALNALLRGDGCRKDIAGTAFIFWTRKRANFDLMNLLDRAEPEQVKALLQFDPQADPDPNMFYMAGRSGNGARLQVRSWIAESLPRVKANLKGWFEGLAVVGPTGQIAAHPKFWQIPLALEREGEPPAHQILSLVRRAVEGQSQPLGYQILNAVLSRLRHPPESKPGGKEANDRYETRFTPVRLGLVRLCLNDLDTKGITMNPSVDLKQNDPAYLCGRLLAVFENLQESVYSSAGESKINMTVADRYYSLASTNPRAAFPKLESLAKSHFRKLSRTKPSWKNAIERDVADLSERIGTSFPPMLSLDGQGRFALGYYHQKAEQTRQRIEASDAKKEKNLLELEGSMEDTKI
jgi:CRISPR-associated protein Csd1